MTCAAERRPSMTKRKRRFLLEKPLLFCSMLAFFGPLCFDTASRAQTLSRSFTADRIVTTGNESRKEKIHATEIAIPVEPEERKTIYNMRFESKVLSVLLADESTY